MAVSQVIEYKRSSSQQLVQSGRELTPTSTYTRKFQVIVDSPATSHSDIYAHPSIPKLFEPHPDNDGVICKKITPEQGDDEESYSYEVTAEYDDQYNGSEVENIEDNNPFTRPAVIQGAVSESEEIVIRDVNGTPIRNSAKDPFDPPVTRKTGNLRFSITKNYAALNLTLLRNYKNAINSDYFYGFAPGVVRIANISFSKQIEPVQVAEDVTLKLVFWQVSFEFELAESSGIGDGTWKRYVLDQGYRTYSGGQYVPITDKYGIAVSAPALLNGSGAAANPNSPVFLSFDIYRSLPFAALGLF